MHRYLSGTMTFALRLTPAGLWMVRGQSTQEAFTDSRGRQSQREVLQPLLDAQKRPLLPASSLKGVLRSTAERILRTIDPDRPADLTPLADATFLQHDHQADGNAGNDDAKERAKRWLRTQRRADIADSQLLEWYEANDHPQPEGNALYPLLSAASQLFGATPHRGLVALEDARAATDTLARRSHVAIDRFTGGVGEGPFLEELTPDAQQPLETTLTIANFALYQIGLLALTFQEINRGYTGIGGGTRKGQGRVRIAVTAATIRYEHRDPAARGIVSAQVRLVGPPWYARDIPPAVQAIEQSVALLADVRPVEPHGWRERGVQTFKLNQAQTERLFAEAVERAWCPWLDVVTREGR